MRGTVLALLDALEDEEGHGTGRLGRPAGSGGREHPVTSVLVVITLVVVVALVVATVVAWRTARVLRRRVADLAETSVPAFARTDDEVLDQGRLVEALRSLADAMIIVDVNAAVVFRNTAAERFRDARHGDALAEEAIARLLAGALDGHGAEHELELYGPPPETLLVRALPLRRSSTIIGAVALISDTSEVHRIERVRRDFVANVSHELKTPIGALSLLAETLAESDDPTMMHQLAEGVLGEAERLGRIVDDLLDLSLIESEEPIEHRSVSVGQVVVEAVERVRPRAHSRGIPVHIANIPDEVTAVCDPQQVVSALTNLLDNAVKYSDAPQRVEIGAERERDRVVITVADHGIGIPTRDLERIFERFYRVDRARSRATGGTGLGLSIVRHVARAHGGDVTAESREGEGSTFRFVIPDQPASPVDSSAAEVS
jgi:two-component system, OmpR family, sensor histidine kinase SenX3